MDVPPAPLAPGTRIGRLCVERTLGAGAHGIVYLARDTDIHRLVALKVLRGPRLLEEAGARQRLLAEARLLGRLRGAHVVHLHHVHRMRGGAIALELEHVEGGSLAARLDAVGTLPAADAARLALDLLDALEEAHALGIVHRDVKPANVLLLSDGSAKLGDFGLAGLGRAASQDAAVAGSPAYLAPEVLLGHAPTYRSDLWSVGVLLHRVLAGREPFEGEDLPQLFFAVLNAAPPALPPKTPTELVRVVARLLAKRPEDRPASAHEARRLLEAAGARRSPSEAQRTLPSADAGGLVGREAEAGALAEALHRTRGGEGGVLVLLGAAGMGKSALVALARTIAHQDGLTCLELRFASGEGLWRGLARVVRERRRRGLPLPLLDPPSDEPVGRALRVLLGEEGTEEVAEHLEQASWALEAWLDGLLAAGPLAVLVEDLHLAAASDVKTLEEVVRRLAGRPLVWVLTARTGSDVGPAGEPALEALAEGGAFPVSARLRLAPLSDEQVDRLVTGAAGGHAPDPEILSHVVRQGGGNPLWTLELVRHLEAGRAIERRDGGLRPGPEWGRLGVPSSFRELVAARSSRLEPQDRSVLEAACVDGVEFDGHAVAAALGHPVLDVLRRLQGLARPGGLLAPGGTGVRFAHVLVRDGLYEALLPEYRRELHRALAQHLEVRSPAADPERIGTHWERAGQPARASPHLLRAALDAARRQEHSRTIDLCERGGLAPGSLTPGLAYANADLLLMAVHAYAASRRAAEQDCILSAIDRGAQTAQDGPMALRAAIERSFLAFYRVGAAGLDRVALRKACAQLPLSKSLGRAHYVLGLEAKYAGDLARAEEEFRRAEEVWTRLGLGGISSSAVDQQASVALRRGAVEEALRLYARAAETSELAGRRGNAAISRYNATLAAADAAMPIDLVASLEEGVARLRREGMAQHAAHGSVHLARALVSRGDLGEALRVLDVVAASPGATLHRLVLADCILERAHARALVGHVPEARADLDRLRSLLEGHPSIDHASPAVLVEQLLRRAEGAHAAPAGRASQATAPPLAGLSASARAELGLLVVELGLAGGTLAPWADLAQDLLRGLPAEPGTGALPAGLHACQRLTAPSALDDGPSLDETAAVLLAPHVAWGRTVLRILGHVAQSHAARARREPAGAARALDAARREAQRFGSPLLRSSPWLQG